MTRFAWMRAAALNRVNTSEASTLRAHDVLSSMTRSSTSRAIAARIRFMSIQETQGGPSSSGTSARFHQVCGPHRRLYAPEKR